MKMWDWLSKLKDMFNWFLNILSRIYSHFLWFVLTFVAGFIFHIVLIYMMNHEDFSLQEIILSGNLLLFLMAVTASVFIDNVVFGANYPENARLRKAFVGLFPIFIISSCTIFLVEGKTILLQQSGEIEFIFMMNIVLFICTLLYAIITRFISDNVQNTRS